MRLGTSINAWRRAHAGIEVWHERPRLNLATLLAFVSLIATAFVARAQNSVCTGERWLPPRELRTREGYTVFLERPSIAPLRGELFLPAWPTNIYDSLGTVVWPLAPNKQPSSFAHIPLGVVLEKTGIARPVPWPQNIPAGPWLPIGVADDRGIAHVIWGSRDNKELPSTYMVRSLWYARFDGHRWSTPTRVLSTDGTVMWSSATVSPLVAQGHSLHLVVAIQGEGLRYVRFDRRGWTEQHVNIASGYMSYPRVAVLRAGRLVLLVEGALTRPPTPSVFGLHLTTSDDGGESWSPLIQISSRDEAPPFDARLLADERDVLYAFWYQQTDHEGDPATGVTLGGTPGRIYATQSFDRGATWRPPTPTPLIDNANELQVLLRPDHSVLAVVADGAGERMLISSWSSSWSPFTVIDAKPKPFNPSLGTDEAQRPFLTWGIRRTHDWLGTMATTLVACR